MDCSLPHFYAHGNFQARVLEWVAIAISIYGNIFHVVFTIMIYLFKVFKLSLQLVALAKHQAQAAAAGALATPRPRSGAEAGRTPCLKGGVLEELPHVQGQGQWPRVPGCDGTGTPERSYPASEVRGDS